MIDGRLSDVSRETLEQFASLVERWTSKVNLVAGKDRNAIWERHIADSLRVAFALPTPSSPWIDLGSGGGFPGIVAAICHRDIEVRLIEADARKAAFLRTVRRELRLSVDVLQSRIEDAAPQTAAVISARALASLSGLLTMAYRHARPGASYVFPKGVTWRQEVEDARQSWQFALEVIDGSDETTGPILVLSDVEPVS